VAQRGSFHSPQEAITNSGVSFTFELIEFEMKHEQWDRACDYLDDDIASGYVRVLQELIAASWVDSELEYRDLGSEQITVVLVVGHVGAS
jgi:hypothetical protein